MTEEKPPLTKEDELRPLKAPMMDTMLAYMHASMAPVLDKIKVSREGPRGYDPEDILVPEGYTVELVATGMNAPVHCCFDDAGHCYVSEAGHKLESKPRVWKVDVTTGEKEFFFELPEEGWEMTGAFTGTCWHRGRLYFTSTGAPPDGRGAVAGGMMIKKALKKD